MSQSRNLTSQSRAKIVVTVGGTDSSGGAGLVADGRAVAALGGHPAGVVTAVTAQSSRRVSRIHPISPALVTAQLAAIWSDATPVAVKSGMVGTAAAAERLASWLNRHPVPYVADPVAISSTGTRLSSRAALRVLERSLFPQAALITPNASEASSWVGFGVRNRQDAVRAGRALLASGCAAVLVKGGHLVEDRYTDVLVTPDGEMFFEGAAVAVGATHGTGCTLAAAIATLLGQGRPLHEAVSAAKSFLARALGRGVTVGARVPPWVQAPVGRLQVITDETVQSRWSHAELAERAAEGGAEVIQYREKRSLPTSDLLSTAATLRRVCVTAQLIVDDRADVCFASGADGVHVGRYDLPAPLARGIVGTGALIGGTANSLEEARALFDSGAPLDYLGVGPVFGTRHKVNPAPRMGLDVLRQICQISPIPIVAIGGIKPCDVGAVLSTGAHGIAVLGGVVCADDPKAATQEYARALAAAERLDA